MKKIYIGMLSALLSAIIFGFTPILAKLAFAGGATGVTATFLRGALSLPFLFVTLRLMKIPLGLGKDWPLVLGTGLIGVGLTTLLLYMSYAYIPVGMATTLHFTYPVLVSLASVVIFKERLTPSKIVALILCAVGISLFLEQGGVGLVGIVLALLSGITYTVYMLLIEKTSLGHYHYYKLTFYFNIATALLAGGFGVATGQLNLHLTPSAWILCLLVALFTAFGALPLLQHGIKLAGASTAAILSTLEPITGVLLGALVLQEEVSAAKLIGCAIIIASILLITLSESGFVVFGRKDDGNKGGPSNTKMIRPKDSRTA